MQLNRILPVVGLCSGLCCTALWAQSASKAPSPEASAVLPLNAAQQAAWGIQTQRIQPTQGDLILATAQVTTRPEAEVTVSAPYAGQIARLKVGIGDRVTRDSGLAEFTSPQLGEARRQWEEARVQAQTAQAALERDRAMLDDGLIPAVRFQQTRARHDAAQASLQARRAELQSAGLRLGGDPPSAGYATGLLLSPIAGVVAETYHAVGQRVEAGTVLFRVIDDRALHIRFQLAGDKAARVRVGDLISIEAKQARARVIGISPFAQDGQMAQGRATVEQRGTLRVGETLTIGIHASASVSDASPAWQVPARALSVWQGQPVVFVRTESGFRATPVTVRSSNDDQSVVSAPALQRQAQIAVSGIAALRAMLTQEP